MVSDDVEVLEDINGIERLSYVEDFKDEIKTHNENVEEEKERHEEEKDKLLENSGVSRVRQKISQVKEKKNTGSKELDNLKDTLFKGIYYTMGRQHTSVKEELTIRDGTVYQYNSSREPSIDKVQNYVFELNRHAKESQKKDLKKGVSMADNINKIEKEKFKKELDSPRFKDKKYVLYELNKPTNFRLLSEEEYRKREYGKSVSITSFYSRSGFETDDMALMLAHIEELEELVDNAIKFVQQEIEHRKELHQKIDDNFKAQFMMGGINK